MKLDILTGGLQTPRPPRKQPEIKPDKTDMILERMDGMLGYLNTDAKTRAEKAAEPIIEQERTALAAQMKALDDKTTLTLADKAVKVNQAEGRLRGLRDLFDKSEGVKGELYKQIADQEKALQKLKDHGEKSEAKAQKQMKEMEASWQAKVQALPVLQSAPATLEPDQIKFEWQRGGTGLLSQVILRAEGFEDTTVRVERFPDNKIRGLDVKGASNE